MKYLLRCRVFWLGIIAVPLVYLGFYLPIYGDEMHWKWKSARWFVDHRIAIDVFPQCVSSFPEFPIWWFPARLLDSILYQDLSSLIKLRILGIFNLLLWLFLIWKICKKAIKESIRKDIFIYGVSILFFGVLPLMMFLNRPEQPLLLCLTGFILLSFLKPEKESQQWTLLIVAAALINLFFSQHVKALFFLPVFISCICFLSMSRKKKVFLFLLLIMSVWTCLTFFNEITSCPFNAHVRQAISGQGVSLNAIKSNPIGTSLHMIRNTTNAHRYLNHIFIWDHYMSYWLPNLPQGLKAIDIFLNRSIRLFWWATLLAIGYLTFRTVIKRDFSSAERGKWIALALFLSLLGVSAFQSTKAFYESSLVFPCLLLMFVLGLSGSVKGSILGGTTKVFSWAALVIAALSVGRLSTHFGPFIKAQWKPGILPSHPFSTSPFHLSNIKSKIEEVNRFCQFSPKKETHLVLDDLTYPFFSLNREPFHIFYLTGLPEGLESFLRERGSSGIISQCRYFSPELTSKAIKSKDEQICCIRLLMRKDNSVLPDSLQ